ncbi:MAG: peptidoglycan-associated lipoprotein Pal, partial [Thiohalomonadaceae bacterium]
MKKTISVLFLIAGMSLFGCAQQQTTPTAEPTDGGAAAPAEGAAPAGAETTPGFTGSPLEDPASPLSKRVFYFPFDSSEVSAEDRDTIRAHAQFLAANPNASVVIEGHADERGSREYNLALGERRAQAIEQLLLLQGMSKGQQEVISFGEERPAAQGHDESAWHLNRR